MIVTTALRTTPTLTEEAEKISKELNLTFLLRNELPICEIQKTHNSHVLVVGRKRLEIFLKGENDPFFFHPNTASFRIKRYLRGENDPFILATKLVKGNTLLDCTLGLASDSIFASTVVGDGGLVVGVEANQYLAYLVKRGLTMWESGFVVMDDAMKRIKVVNHDHLTYLKQQPSDSFDVVYLDPMFQTEITSSDGINPLRILADYRELTTETLEHAKRVAIQRVVLKDHWKSSRFQQFGFSVYKRPTASFHYGTIELSKK